MDFTSNYHYPSEQYHQQFLQQNDIVTPTLPLVLPVFGEAPAAVEEAASGVGPLEDASGVDYQGRLNARDNAFDTDNATAAENTPAPGSLTNIQARDWYNAQVAKIDAVEQQMRAAGKSAREIYETTSPMRNAAKQTTRDLMSNRAAAESLPPIKTPEEYLQKYGGDYEKALEAVKRTNPRVNAETEARRARGEQ